MAPTAERATSHPGYGQSCIASRRRRRRIAHFNGSRSRASYLRHVRRVKRSSLARSIVATMRMKHSTTTGGHGLRESLGSGRVGRGRSSSVNAAERAVWELSSDMIGLRSISATADMTIDAPTGWEGLQPGSWAKQFGDSLIRRTTRGRTCTRVWSRQVSWRPVTLAPNMGYERDGRVRVGVVALIGIVVVAYAAMLGTAGSY